MTTQPNLRCSHYRCNKQAQQMPAGTEVLNTPSKNYLAVLYCNVHAGAEKRSTYPRVAKFWEPISDDVRAVARAQQAQLDAQRRKRDSEDREREHQHQRDIAAYEWEKAQQEDEYVILYSEEYDGDRRIWTIQTKTLAEATDEESIDRRKWHREAQVIVDERENWDDVTGPVDVDMHWSSRATPRLSIAMAEALTAAANVAAAINARRYAKHLKEK